MVVAWVMVNSVQQGANVQRYFSFAWKEYRGQPDTAKERLNMLCRNMKLLSVPVSTLLFKQAEGNFAVKLPGSVL